jgi:uncharacterized membrane protein YsdA (DUF1294 family)
VNPYWRFGLLCFGAALGLTVAFSFLLDLIPAWLVAINLVAVFTYRYDKTIAGSRATRVPEKILLLLNAAGGTIGAAIAMWLMRPRHKTQSEGFLTWFFLIVFLQAAAIFAYFYFALAWGGMGTI